MDAFDQGEFCNGNDIEKKELNRLISMDKLCSFFIQ